LERREPESFRVHDCGNLHKPLRERKKRLGDQTTSTKKRAVIPGQEHNIQSKALEKVPSITQSKFQ
jgi:hypothetical protein